MMATIDQKFASTTKGAINMTTALTAEAIAEIINVGMQIKNDDSFATWLRLGKDIVFIDKVKENAGKAQK